jgi:uncharacterized Ntn-hydrolase superfamily protein
MPAMNRILAALAALAMCAPPSLATWSIAVVNTKTGEVAIASATCIPSFPLARFTPVVRVGQGTGVIQSAGDEGVFFRRRIWQGLIDGLSPQEILDANEALDPNHQTRQYGIVDFANDPVSFTGAQNGNAAGGVTGIVGDYRYAIQGNVLTGSQVWLAAEAAFLLTDGDLGQKLLAGMVAAREFGGDGRCSCHQNAPTSCGVPPPNFVRSSNTAFLIIARIGDTDGLCNPSQGCASGQYYMNLQEINSSTGPDPVDELEVRYASWRAALSGRPDHVLSRVVPENNVFGAGREALIKVELRDVDDEAIPHGGALVELVPVDPMQAPLFFDPRVEDLGDGAYSIALKVGPTPGVGRFHVVVDDGMGAVTLVPALELSVVKPLRFR